MTARVFARAAVLLLGLLTGAMLFIAVVLAPIWRAMPPAEFQRWFAANVERIARLMIPLGVGGMAAAVLALVAGWRAVPARRWLVLAAAAAIGVVAITLAVNEPANRLFATAGALTESETTLLLERWTRWHSARVALGIGAFYASMRALESG